MAHYIDKDRIVAEIERRVAEGEKVVKELPSSAIMGLIQAYKNTLSFIDTLEVIELPIWEKVSPDTGQTILYKDGNKSYLERFGYRIDLKDLDKLPKIELKAQKGE